MIRSRNQQAAAVGMAAASGFILGMGAYVALEWLWGAMP
jgi:hypothetical protein